MDYTTEDYLERIAIDTAEDHFAGKLQHPRTLAEIGIHIYNEREEDGYPIIIEFSDRVHRYHREFLIENLCRNGDIDINIIEDRGWQKY